MSICNLDANKELGNAVASLINLSIKKSIEANSRYSVSKDALNIYESVYKNTKDQNKALGVAAAVPQMFLKVLGTNPSYLNTLLDNGLKIDEIKKLNDEILNSKTPLDLISEKLRIKKNISIKTILSNIIPDYQEAPAYKRVTDSGIAIINKLLNSLSFFNTTINERKIVNSVAIENVTNEKKSLFGNVIKKLLTDKNNNDDIENFNDLKLKALYENNLPDYEENTVNPDVGRNSTIILALTDKKGNFLYFKNDGTLTTKENGKIAYSFLKEMGDKNVTTLVNQSLDALKTRLYNNIKQENTNLNEESIIQLLEKELIGAEKKFKDYFTEQKNQLLNINNNLQNNQNVLLSITGGIKGFTTNLDTLSPQEKKDLIKSLDNYKLSDKEERSIKLSEQSTKDNKRITKLGIQFDNLPGVIDFTQTAILENQDLLNNIADVLFDPLTFKDGTPISANQRKDYLRQFLFISNNILDISNINNQLKFIDVKKNKTFESKEEFKELVKNIKIKFDKALYTNNEYSEYKINNNIITEIKSPYKPFVFKYYKPNVVFDLTTQSAMVINGYLSFVPEVGTVVEEKTPEVKKLEKKIEDDYEDLNRSLLLKNHATAEQNEKAKNWWKESALSKAVDSTGNPLFTLTFLQNIANSDAWANFRNSAITLYKGSNYTDLYHEAWHAFSQLYLTKAERTVLYDKIGALPGSFTVIRKVTSGGVTNSSKVIVKFSEASRKEKEEFIAEEFKIYAKNNGKFKVETPKNSFLKRLFDKIWKALKALVGNVEEFSNPGSQGVLSNIFNTLYSAKTAKDLNLYTPTINNIEFGSLNSGIIIDEKVVLSASDADWISRSIDGLIGKKINILMAEKVIEHPNNVKTREPGKVGAITKLLKGDVNLKLLYDNYIKKELINKLNELENEYSEKEKSWTELEKDIKKNRIRILNATLNNYGDITSILKGEIKKNSTIIEYHRNNSVFKEALASVSPLEKTIDKGINDTNSFELADNIAKLLISSLLKQEKGAEDDQYELNELGFPETIDFKSFWNLLMSKVSGKKTVTGMYQKLTKVADKNSKNSPLFKQLLNRIGQPEDMNETGVDERDTSPDIWIGLAQSLSLSNIALFSSTINKNVVKNDNDILETVYEFKPGVTSKETYKIKKDWVSKFIQEKSTDANYILKNKSNVNYLNLPKIIKDFYTKETFTDINNVVKYTLKKDVDIIKFFNSIGIYLDDSIDIKNNINQKGLSSIAEAIGKAAFNQQEITDILSHFNKKIKNIKEQKIENKVITLINGNIESLYNRFEELSQLQATYSDTYASTMGKSADNENKSVYALTNSNIMLTEGLNEISTLGDAYDSTGDYKHLNHLNPKNNPAIKFSVIMKSLFDLQGKKRKNASIKWVDITGSQFILENSTEQEGKTQADMYKSDKFISDFLTYLKTGVIEYIRNGDKKTFLAPLVDLITYNKKKNKNLFIDTSAFLVDDFGSFTSNINPNTEFLKLIYDKLEGELRRIKMIKADPEYYNSIKYFENADKLTFFDAILESKEHGSDIKNELTSDAFLNLLKDDTDIYDALNAYTSDKKIINKSTIDTEILSYFDIETERLKKVFDDVFSHDTTIINDLLKNIVYSELSENDINNLQKLGKDAIKNAALKSFTYNTWLNSAELTTLYLSDNFQFDHEKDAQTKRVSPYQSGGRIFFYDNVVLNYINKKLGRSYEEELIKKGLLIKKEARTDYDGTINTSIIRESIIRSRYYDMYNAYFTNVIRKQTPGITQDEMNIKLYGEKGTVAEPTGGYMKPYSKIKNGDGQGWITFDMYRILKRSENAWSIPQENLYQKIIKNEDVSSIDVTEFFPVYKLQYAGPLVTKEDKYPVQSIDKFSLMPLIPNVFKDTALEQLHLAMMSQNIDYSLFESGAKRAYIKKNPNSNGDLIYGESIKTQIRTNSKSPVNEYLEIDTSKIFKYTDIELTNNKKYVAYLKNQTEINSIDKGESTLSTQMRKIFNLGLYAKGYPVDFEGTIKEWKALSKTEKLEKSIIHKKCEDIYKKLERWTSIEKAELLENMGLIESYDSKNETYTINPKNDDISDFITYIKNELIKQDYSEEELKILNNKIGSTIDISISPFAPRIEKALTALINNRLVKLKSKGAALVEVSPTFTPKWKNPTEEDIKEYKNDDIPSYVVDINGEKDTKGCGVKIAITKNYENLYQTSFFTKNNKNEYVKSKETIAVYDEVIDPQTKKTKKVLNEQKSFIRLNQMIRVQEWKNDSDNRKKINIAGVRIPTQGPNSIEFAEIFEFLPASAGNIIIIPAEIVAKSGTDFDVDKLTTYIKYINKFGDLLKDSYKTKEDLNVVIKDLEAKKKQLLALQTTITAKKAQGLTITDNLADFRKKIRDLNFNKNIGKDTLRLFTQTDNKILLTTLNNKENQNYLKENLKAAYSIYEKEIKGFDVKDLDSINEELQELYKETTPFSKVFRELSAAKEQKRNFINGIQNDFIDDLISIMQMPEMAFSLLQANSTHIAQPYSDELKPIIQENDNEINYNIYSKTGKQVSNNKNAISPSHALSYSYNLGKHQDNKSGKESLGVGALDNPINNILNILGTTLKGSTEVTITELDANKKQIFKKVTVPIDLKLNVNYTKEVDKALREINVISLSNLTDSEKNNNIGEVISQLMNGFVDVGTDNWVAYIQGNLKTVPTILFLLQAGVPLGDIVYFVTNPMIRNYTKEVSKQESLFSELIYGSNHTKDFAKSQAKDFLDLRLQELNTFGVLSTKDLQEFKRNTRGKKGLPKSSFYAYHKLLNILKPENFTTDELQDIAYSKEVPKFIKDGYQNNLLKGQLAGFIQYLYIEELVKEFDFVKNNMKPDTNVSMTSMIAAKKTNNLNKAKKLNFFSKKTIEDVQTTGPIYPFYIEAFIKNVLTNVFKFRNNPKIMEYLLKSTNTPKKISDIKEKTGYDEDTYYNKYLNAFMQYIFTNSLKKYKPKDVDYNQKKISDLIDIEQVKDDFTKGTWKLKGDLNAYSFNANQLNDFIEFNLERASLKSDQPLNDVFKKTNLFIQKQEIMQSIFAKSETESVEDYTSRIDNIVYDNIMNNQALHNTYNNYALFKGDNSIASVLLNIINTYKLDEKYNILRQFSANTGEEKARNFKLNNSIEVSDNATLKSDYNKQLRDLADPSINKITINNETDRINNNYINNFFDQLPLISFLQSGMDSSEYNLMAVMPDKKYLDVMQKGVERISKLADKNNFSSILKGFQTLFLQKHDLKYKKYRSKGLDYNKSLETLLELADSIEDQPFIEEISENTFILLDKYTLFGKTEIKTVTDSIIYKLKVENPDVIFLLTNEDLGITTFPTTKEELDALSIALEQKIQAIKASGKKVVLSSKGFGQQRIPKTAIKTVKIISDADIDYYNKYLTKSAGKFPVEFFTSVTTFKEFFNPETGKREKAPQSSKWILQDNSLYNLVDKETGEIYITDVDLKTGLKTVFEKPIQTSTNVPTTPISKANNPSEYTNYSGAARGADTVWAEIGKEFGIGKQVDYVPQTLQKLNKTQQKEVEDSYQQVLINIGRRSLTYDWTNPNLKDANGKSVYYSGGLVRRDYLQAKAADAIFAISTIELKEFKTFANLAKKLSNKYRSTWKKVVAGGTAYAVHMGINMGKPVYVFDQNKNKWFTWKDGTFVETETPILTPKFAGIGTREIDESGKKAIRDVYANTFKAQSSTSVKEGIKIPAYTVDINLTNANGTKRLASTSGTTIKLNPVKSVQEFFNYFEGNEVGPSSAQKKMVLVEMEKQGYPLKKIKSILNTTKLANTFLVLHEQDHIDQNDVDVYWKMSKSDLLTPDKLLIETRASINALKKIESTQPSTNVEKNNDYNRAFNLTLNESLKENLDYSNPGSENATVSDIITRMPIINDKDIEDTEQTCKGNSI